MIMSHSFPLNVTTRQAKSSIEQEESMMSRETRQLIEMEESECSSSSSDEEEAIMTESNDSGDTMPSLLSFPNHSLRLETIYEQQDMAVSSDGGSLSSAALTCVLAYGLVLALVMGFVATVLATAPGHFTSYMRNKKNN